MALRLEDISVTYGSRRVVADLWLDAPGGCCTGFLGHNGAGKTTAMRAALGLVRPSAGRVLVDGFDAHRHPREARARMGALIEVCHFQESKGGYLNLVELGRLGGLERGAARREAARRIEQVGLGHAASKPVAAYSQGMRQRLGLAQALLGSPTTLLLDEPTNGLDPEGIHDVRALVRELVEREGCSILLSSHLLAELAGVCDRVAVLREGRLVVQGNTAELLAGGGARYRVEVEDGARARAALERLELAPLDPRERTGGGLLFNVELGSARPAAVTRALGAAGLVEFRAEDHDLAAFYRRASRGELPSEPHSAPATAVEPHARRAPAGPLMRLLGYEHRRLMRAGFWLLLLVPAVIGAAAIGWRALGARALAKEVELGTLATTTDVTAFEALGRGLGAGLPVVALLVLGLASQLIAAEHARGTLRNVLLRPVGRMRTALAKALVVAGAATASYAALLGVCAGLAAYWFDFTDVSELLPNGERFAIVPMEELWPEMRTALLGALWPLLAYGGIGLGIGALVRNGTGALATAFGCVLGLDLLRALVRGDAMEAWLPGTYLPSPLIDTSAVRSFALLSEGVANAPFNHQATALAVPLLWALVGTLIAVQSLARRAVP